LATILLRTLPLQITAALVSSQDDSIPKIYVFCEIINDHHKINYYKIV